MERRGEKGAFQEENTLSPERQVLKRAGVTASPQKAQQKLRANPPWD